MDPQAPVAIATAVSGVIAGATGAAGRDAWIGFSKWVRVRFEHDEEVQHALGELQEGVDGSLESLASALAHATDQDPGARNELAEILEIPSFNPDGVSNSVTGTVNGTLIQGRDIGSINL